MAAPSFPVDPTDLANLTPEQRLDELARLLAAGARRLFSRPPTFSPDSDRNGLDVPPGQSVHADAAGLTAQREHREGVER